MKNALSRMVLLWISLLPVAAFAQTYHVSTSGHNSNPGTAAAPFRNIDFALTKVVPGATVIVHPGIYNERVVMDQSGTASAPITLRSESVIDRARITGTGLTGGALVEIVSGVSYVRVIDLDIGNLRGGDTPIGISIDGSANFIELRSNVVHHIANPNQNAHGIAIYGSATTPISNLVMDGNEIHSCELGQSEALVLNGNVTHFAVINNFVHDNDNIGIDFIGYEGTGPSGQDQARDGICIGNRVVDCSSATNPTYDGERSAGGIYIDGGKNIIIERNTIDNCDIGIEVASEHRGRLTSGITVRNNFVSRSFQGNLMVGGYGANRGGATDIKLLNNTLHGGSDGEIILQYNCNDVTMQNNICVAKSGNDYVLEIGRNNTNVTLLNNLYFGSSTTSPGSWSDARAVYVDPKLLDSYMNMHLHSDSPAINRGINDGVNAGSFDIDGHNRVQGAQIDLGADEVYWPPLRIEITGTHVTMSWPRAATNFNLEATGDLSSDGPWRTVGASPDVSDVSGREQSVTEPASSAAKYFRLRSQ